jgi:hypothetical protein
MSKLAYVYRAALYCEVCADKLHEKIFAETPTKVPSAKEIASCDLCWDSDDYPAGPYCDGGGEADCPQHCHMCGEFLENPLTSDGVAYVREACREPNQLACVEWLDFYADELAHTP